MKIAENNVIEGIEMENDDLPFDMGNNAVHCAIK